MSQEGDHFLVTYKGSKRDLLLGYTNLYEFTKHTYVIICIYIYIYHALFLYQFHFFPVSLLDLFGDPKKPWRSRIALAVKVASDDVWSPDLEDRGTHLVTAPDGFSLEVPP